MLSRRDRQTADATDWKEILALYGVLMQMSDNPMVALNHAVAAAMVYGPTAGLELIAGLEADPRMANSHRTDAVRGHLFERAGNSPSAIPHYERAAARATNTAERNYLLTQAARLRDAEPS